MQRFIAYLIGVISAYLSAVVFLSQFNIASITQMGFEVGMGDRFQTVLHDLLGMTSLYLPLIAVAFLIAFLFTRFVLERFLNSSVLLYSLAGFVALLVLHLALNSVFGIHAIAPTRSTLGLLSQALAGGLGGFVFYRWLHRGGESALA